MKVCILSMQKVNNFGSLLQSYSLKKLIESLGHTVDFIDIERIDEDDKLLKGNSQDYFDEGEGQGLFSKLKKIDKYFFNRIHIKKLQKSQDSEFYKFRDKVLNAQNVDNSTSYDMCVIGSDEVFNCLTPSPWGFTSQLFGNVRQAKKVITYAASCGATKYENVPDPVRNRIRQAFENVSAFSVRDKNTYEFVEQLTESPIELNLDPVVVGNFKEEMANVGDISSKLPAHYCVVYSYYNRISDKNDIKTILDFCKKNKLVPVSIGAPQKWIKNHVVLTPFEVLVAFKNADFVITDTFHGTIFSAKYANKFAVMVRESNRNKLMDLIERLQIQGHLVSSMDQIHNAFLIKSDKKAINDIIIVEQEKTKQYLLKNLGKTDDR